MSIFYLICTERSATIWGISQLLILSLRKDIVISLDSNAKITEIEDFSPTDKNLSYWDGTVKSRTKKKRYFI